MALVEAGPAGDGSSLVRSQELKTDELADEEKPVLLRAYLERWKWEVGTFFDGVGPDSHGSKLRRIASDHPVFRIAA